MNRLLKTLPLATVAVIATASLPAKSFVTPHPITGTGAPIIESEDDGDISTTSGFETIALIKEGSPDPVPIKDLAASCLPHGALKVHHGSPGVTYRFENRAPHERTFRLFDIGIDQSALVTKAFSVPPGGSVEFTLFTPLAVERGSRYARRYGVTLEETTPGKPRKTVHVSHSQLSEFCGKDNSDPSLLISANVSAKKMRADLTAAMRQQEYTQRHKKNRSYYSSRHSGEEESESYAFSARKFKFAPEGWPRDWRCYSTYDAIVVTAGEYVALPDEVKSALDVYRLLGGAVIVTGGQDGFANTTEAARALSEIDDSFDALTGDLGISSYYYSHYSSSSDVLVKSLGFVPIETKSTLPLKTLLAVLAVFALVVVPLTVFHSVRRNARMKLLILLPASSAAIAIAVAAFAYAFFGVTPYVRLQSVTILDQTSKRALTRGQFGIFSPVSIGSSLAFPLDAAFRMRHAHSEGGDNSKYTVEVSDVQRLANGWTAPLVSSFFDFERACERSERLDFHVSPSGEVKVVNLLGAKVVWGQANVGGQMYMFSNLPPGGEAKANKISVKPHAASKPRYPFTETTSFGRDWNELNLATKRKLNETQPGEYVAEVEGSPFFPNPLTGRKSHASEAGLVFGRFKEVAE